MSHLSVICGLSVKAGKVELWKKLYGYEKRKTEVLLYLTLTAHILAAQYPGTPQTKNLSVHVMEAYLMLMVKELKDLLLPHLNDMKQGLKTEPFALENF